MEVALTWDLLVIVFFALVVAYSFIVGKNESVKIIIATYIALIAVQAIGNLLELLSDQSQSVMDMLGFGLDMNIISIIKLILFVVTIIAIAIRGGFEMEYAKDLPGAWDPVVTAGFGFATSGLLLSSLLTFVAAKPLLDDTLPQAPLLQPLIMGNPLIQAMVEYQNIWFCLPAILLLIVGFIASRNA